MSPNKREAKLTKGVLESLRPETKPYPVWDTQLSGFYVRVSPKGKLTFYLKCSARNRQYNKSIGTYPHLHPDTARSEALRRKIAIDSGDYKRKPDATFGDVMSGYADTLLARGAADAANTRRHIVNHIETPFPFLWSKRAIEITPEDCVDIVRRLIKAEKLRTADIIRSYMYSAFELAITADPNKADSMPLLRMSNPAKMKPVRGAIKPRERHLSESELRHLWRRIQSLEFPKKQIFSLWILTGAQRQQQLARVTTNNIHELNIPGTGRCFGLELTDTKGRTGRARSHMVPLTPASRNITKELAQSGWMIFSTNGVESIEPNWLTRQLKPIVSSMKDAGELEGEPFTAGAVRSTVETLLGKYGVSREDRGHLQSHGNSGVQAMHYDRHDYAGQKLAALEIWESLLEKTQ
ncbi:integrase family protein [Luminiphilus sp.]|nr:integrase family protein [Luminiphilus sp.]